MISTGLFDPNAAYMFLAVNDKKFVLDVSQDPKEKGKLIIWKKKGDRNQLFRIVYNPNNGWYQIISCLDQRVISAPGNAPDNGQLLVEDNKFMQGQSWKIELIPDKKYNDRYYVKNGF